MDLLEAIVAPRRAFVPLPDLAVIDREDWFEIATPSFKDGGFNEVALARVDVAEIEATITRTLAAFRARGCAFRWTVGPDSAPADLAARLEARGFAPSPVRVMTRATADAVDDVAVVRVTPASADAYTRTMAAGWDVDPAPLAPATALALVPGSTHRLYLALVDGEPAAVASAVHLARAVYLLGGVVLPRYRGRGAYRALVDARLADARAAGLAHAIVHARDTSAPRLARGGFTTVATLTAFHIPRPA